MALRLTPAQYQAITRYRFGLAGSRPKDVPKITASSYGYVLVRWKNFDAWNHWQDAGKPSPRPKNVWTRVPAWDGWTPWDLRKEILKARPHVPPTPPEPPKPPLPPLPANAARVQNVSVGAWDPMAALAWPGCKIWFSADPDPKIASNATAANADLARSRGHEVGVWYVPDQVDHSQAVRTAQRLGTNIIACDCETLGRWKIAWANGVRLGIANLSALWEDGEANARIADGSFVVTNEFYWNQAKYRRPDNHNLPVASLCIAVYNGCSDSQEADCWEPHVPDYKAAGYWWSSMSVYQQNMRDSDWAALPRPV